MCSIAVLQPYKVSLNVLIENWLCLLTNCFTYEHLVYICRGPKFDTKLRGVENVTVDSLLQELYEKVNW